MTYERTTADPPPDAGALAAFLAASVPPVMIGDGGVSVGKLRDEAGAVIGWRADIDADEFAVQIAMQAWAAPPDPATTLEDALSAVLAAILAIPEGERTLAEQAAVIYATMLRPDLLTS